jgi:hypothetical protein
MFQKGVVERNANADSVLRNYFLGTGFAKPRLIFQKDFWDLDSAPQEGSGEECGADSFLDFWRAGIKSENTEY